MNTLFIADLHLEESRPEITAIFFKFLREYAAGAKALYLLGDIFEIWIGDDDHSPFNQSIIDALQQCRASGTELYFMPGNRDFLIGKKFKKAAACQGLPDEHVVHLNGLPTLLMHGDTLCTEDLKYLKFRKRTRNFFVQKYFLFKSLAIRRAMGRKARELSMAHTSNTAAAIMDVTENEVKRVMKKHQVQHLIHGHTHRPAVHHFEIEGQAATRTVLAPWHEEGSALIFHPDGQQEFITIK